MTRKETEMDISMERQPAVHGTCLTTDSTADVPGLRKGSPQWPLPSMSRLNHLDTAKPSIRLIAIRRHSRRNTGHSAVWAQIFAVRYCPKYWMYLVKNPWDIATGQMLHK